MIREELIARTRQLVAEGERLQVNPTLRGLQTWLQLSDDLLVAAWGSMDRYHLAWLMVGKPKGIVRGRAMTPDEEAAYVREVADAKTAALRMSLDAVERQGMPFVGEERGIAPGQDGHAAGRAGGVTSPATTIAAGGERQVPVPDAIARDYLLLALRLDQHIPGLVDAYYGPADLKALVDIESLRAPAALADDADALHARLEGEVAERDRRDWLGAQLVALATQARALAGDPLPYLDHVRGCFAWEPVRRADAVFDAAAAELDVLLPGPEPLAHRLAAWDARFVIPVDRLLGIVDWLVGQFRSRAVELFGAPDGEDLRVSLVTGQPWTAYNWYDGGLRSRVDLNLDLPMRAADLVHTVAHETFPGHHLEHAWKEATLVERQRRLEASILLINTPECLISEGLADIGRSFVDPPDETPDLLVELYERAGLPIATDPAAARDAALRSTAMAGPRRRLAETRVNAALMRHADGASHEAVLDYLERVGRFSAVVAAKRLEFIEHPLWRTYVFVYHEGEALLRRWLEAVEVTERPARFGRLLREELTPVAIAAEIGPDAG